MQNKGKNGCYQGFVPVTDNWDFNCCDQYQQNYGRRNRRTDERGCDERGKSDARSRSNDGCQCDRCNDSRKVEYCDQNTYIRRNDCDCQYDRDQDERTGNDRGRNNGCQKRDECECAYQRGCSACTGRDDCQCETCVRSRNRSSNSCEKDCGCDENKYENRSRSGDCGCKKDDGKDYSWNRSNCGCNKDNDNVTTYARSGKNRKVGMVNVQRQEIDDVFESESALRAGTLFPELHKPMNGYCPYDKNCGTCKQQAAFAAWEMRLYLNTHPNDKEALALFCKLCNEAEEENYATTFLTDECCTNVWNWVKNPWPWEYDCQCGD